MGFFHEYPYTDFHEINLDWILKQIMKLHKDWDEFRVINAITFDGEWDITKQYPAWCIVNWNNGQEGYISIKPVPAGVTINNTDYWVSVVNYTATIADLQNRVAALESEVGKKRKFVFLGDSYSVGTSGGITPTNFGWVDQTIEMLGLTADQYEKCTVSDIGLLPAFYPTNASHRSWRDSIEIMYNRMDPDFPDQVTDVVVCGGYNEIFGNDINATYTGMQDFMDYVKVHFPNAKYWLGAIGMNVSSASIDTFNARNFLLMNVIPTYARGSELGFTCMGNTHRCLWNNTQTDDGIHPDRDTYTLIAETVTNNLLGSQNGAYKDNANNKLTFTWDTSEVTYVGGTDDIYAVRLAPEGGTLFSFDDTYTDLNIVTPQLLNPTVELTLGTLDRTYIPAGLKDTVFNVGVYTLDTNNNRMFGPGHIIITPTGTVKLVVEFVVTVNVARINIYWSDAYIPYPLILS